MEKLIEQGVNSNLVLLIHKFLTSKKQYVRFKSLFSSAKTIKTGGLQGCVLSAGLFTLYTSDIECSHDKRTIFKYGDDTVIVPLFDDSDDTNGDNCYVHEIDLFVLWCRNNFLHLHVKKTKEMIMDYRVEKEIIEWCS